MRAVAIRTSGCAEYLAVHALFVSPDIVAGLTLNRLEFFCVRDLCGIKALVAVHAVQRFMDGALEQILVSIKLNLLPPLMLAQCGLAVTRKALLVRLGQNEARKEQDQDREKNTMNR